MATTSFGCTDKDTPCRTGTCWSNKYTKFNHIILIMAIQNFKSLKNLSEQSAHFNLPLLR